MDKDTRHPLTRVSSNYERILLTTRLDYMDDCEGVTSIHHLEYTLRPFFIADDNYLYIARKFIPNLL